MVNKVILIGNLGKDPEIRSLESKSKVATFTIATNESYKDKNNVWQTNTEWHNIVAWNYLADKAERELKKGSTVFIEGKLTNKKYSDKNGVEKYITEIIASTLTVLDKKDRIPVDSSSMSGVSGAPTDNSDMPF